MPSILTPERSSRAGGPGLSYALASKLCGVPLYMTEKHGHQLRQALDDRVFDGGVEALAGVLGSKFIGTYDGRSRFRVTDDGVALVAVSGMLIDRGPWLGDLGGFATSYEGLAAQVQTLAKDGAIKHVVLDIDSGGGMVAGLFDLCEEIRKLRREKPVTALAANFAASAAYALACTADEVYVTRTGEVGSIGVIMIHQSIGRALDERGVDTTIICEPETKADGNPFTALSHGARADMAASVAESYRMFVGHVAKHRDLAEDAVKGTQARLYSGEAAVAAGLADGVKSIEEVLAHIRKGGSRNARQSRSKAAAKERSPVMGARDDQPGEGASYDTVIAAALQAISSSNAALAAAVKTPAPAVPAAAVLAAEVVAPVADVSKAADDARVRIKAILNCDAAKERQGLATHLALETDIDAETAMKILGVSPSEKPAATAHLYKAIGASGGTPQVSPSGGDKAAPTAAEANIERQKARFAVRR